MENINNKVSEEASSYLDRKDIYKIWAPQESIWSRWVIPVPFIKMNEHTQGQLSDTNFIVTSDTLAVTDYAFKISHAAIFVDCIDTQSISEGLSLASQGFIPIPSFSTTAHQHKAKALIDNEICELALLHATEKRLAISLPDNAPPAFLLDSNRLNMKKTEISTYDNSYDKFEQDFPSAAFFKSQGITNIIVKSTKVSRDLKPIFYKFQKQGLSIYLAKTGDNAKKITIRKFLNFYI